jgi:hypothetical protein
MLWGCGKPITSTGENSSSSTGPLMTGVSEEILLDTSMSLNFDLLPLKGTVDRKERLWSGDSWRLNRGAINFRWNAQNQEGFAYMSPNSREIIAYPVPLLKSLSPSEKYDILMGRYDYPMKMEVDWLARSGVASWEGLCHGWAGASLNHPEPEAKVLTNPDGVEVYFGSADIKALVTYAYSKKLIRPTESIGLRCEGQAFSDNDDNCDNDLSALTFHAVMANKVGLRGQSFIMDIDRYNEVWNHPILSYESVIEKMTMASRNSRTAIIRTKISYVDIIERNTWDKSNKPMVSYLTVKYRLDMDEHGNLTDSEWLSHDRPDFIWTVSRQDRFEGYLSRISELIK